MIELQLKPHTVNIFPQGGILIHSPSVAFWLRELQRMQLSLNETAIYPIPGNIANSTWGCMVITNSTVDKHTIGRNEFCQQARHNIFIPQLSTLYPTLSEQELDKKFPGTRYLIHPSFGFAELPEPLNISELLEAPEMRSYHISQPAPGVYIPEQIVSFQQGSIDPEDIIKEMEEKVFPQKEQMPHKPLSVLEKGKLKFYRLLFNKNKDKNGKGSTGKTKAWEIIGETLGRAFNIEKLNRKMEEDFEDLEKRSQKEADRLMEMLRDNPLEALKYAIPLDSGAARGSSSTEAYKMSKLWSNLSLYGNTAGGSGSVSFGDEYYYKLQKEYMDTAEKLIQQGKYHDAAFVYLKLLRSPYRAAETLEKGEHYKEAATIYLKHCNNELKAAECYENTDMITDAIELYKKNNKHEKVGDLYNNIGKRKEANEYYQKTVDEYLSLNKYIKASIVCENKMHNIPQAQSLLKEGWEKNSDATNCLAKYLENIEDHREMYNEMLRIRKTDLTTKNNSAFLHAIKNQYDKNNELTANIKQLAYEVVAEYINNNEHLASDLKMFNPGDQHLLKDILRYKMKNRRR